jgi:NitT/TauT family transport system permease protein
LTSLERNYEAVGTTVSTKKRKKTMSSATLSIEELESMTRRAAPARTRWSLALLRQLAIRLVSLAAFVALWELASDSKARFIVNFAHVPAPSAVAEAAVHFFQSPKAVRHIASSIKRVAAGFGIATLLAIPLGLLIGRARWAEDTLFTPLEILRPIPGVAWIPLAILMFATSEQSMDFLSSTSISQPSSPVVCSSASASRACSSTGHV